MTPATIDELREAVLAAPRVQAVGAQTKPRLSETPAGVEKISTRQLRGILEYDPSEFTFTALAGTPVSEIQAALGERGQYLPFDPPLAEAGSTIGGVVASGLSGPGRFRYGGVRDFILGVRFVDGRGRLLRLGGKVVKNAAGFDVPKFLVGSLGRFGAIGEVTFKVFPRPAAALTLRIKAETLAEASKILVAASVSRWELDAADVLPGGCDLALRLVGPMGPMGPMGAVGAIAEEILSRWKGEKLAPEAANALWAGLGGFSWVPAGHALAKLPVTPAEITRLEGFPFRHISAGGNVAFVAAPTGQSLHETASALGLRGLLLRGAGPLWPGGRDSFDIEKAVKAALDPDSRFPTLDH